VLFCRGLASEALSIALPLQNKLCWSCEIPVFVLHYIVELPTDWPVKPSSPLSAVAYTSTASHYRSAIIQLTVISWLSSLVKLSWILFNMDWWIFIFYWILDIWHLKSSLIRYCWIFVTAKWNWNGSIPHWFVWSHICLYKQEAPLLHPSCLGGVLYHISHQANQPNSHNGPQKLPNSAK